jgi:ribosome recycling factor
MRMAADDVAIVLGEAKDEMDKSLRSLRIELQKVRTGRANPALLENVQVDYYGTPTPLRQLANLSAPDPRLIVVSPYDRGAITDLERAIKAANLGFTPNNDGKIIRLPIPPLTEERRKDLVKQVKKMAEEHKIGVRDARRSAMEMIKELEDDGTISADDKRRVEKQVQDLTDDHTKKIDEMIAHKEKEVLEV